MTEEEEICELIKTGSALLGKTNSVLSIQATVGGAMTSQKRLALIDTFEKAAAAIDATIG